MHPFTPRLFCPRRASHQSESLSSSSLRKAKSARYFAEPFTRACGLSSSPLSAALCCALPSPSLPSTPPSSSSLGSLSDFWAARFREARPLPAPQFLSISLTASRSASSSRRSLISRALASEKRPSMPTSFRRFLRCRILAFVSSP
ncbi:hypothetical protein GQ53DRAFT_239151 [Thozetella sp. PMI_491]|nr:hypothetical protein GQ53DRAFT_239151 [Thozetella sp. PMI_491]